MNLIITPFNFKTISPNNTKKKNAYVLSSQNNTQFSKNYASAIKNQILFKGNFQTQNSSIAEEMNEKYELNLPLETIEFLLNSKNFCTPQFSHYIKIGDRIFKPFLKQQIIENFPNKKGEELVSITQNTSNTANKARIAKEIYPIELQEPSGQKAKLPTSANYFLALIGAIASADDEKGTQNAYKFLQKHICPILISPNREIKENYYDKLQKTIEKQGKSYEDVYIQHVIEGKKHQYNVYYKDILLAQSEPTNNGADSIREQCVYQAIDKINENPSILDNASDNLPYKRFKYPSPAKIRRFEELKRKYNIPIEDMTLLNQATLFGIMKDNSTIPPNESNQRLDFIGQSVVHYCIEKGFKKYHPEITNNQMNLEVQKLASYENLSKVAKSMMLWTTCDNKNTLEGKNLHGEMFSALLGAIYIDGKEKGLDNAFKFIEDNFAQELFCAPNKEKQEEKVKQDTLQKEKEQTYILSTLPIIESPSEKTLYEIDIDIENYAPRNEITKAFIDKYHLKVKPETIDFIFNYENLRNEYHDYLQMTGELAFNCYLRNYLAKTNPYKTAHQLTKLENANKTDIAASSTRMLVPKTLRDFNTQANKNLPYARYFYALLGAIIEADEVNGDNDMKNFIDNYVKNNFPYHIYKQEPSKVETLQNALQEAGCSPKEIFIETKFYGVNCFNRIFYRDMLMAQQTNKNIHLLDAYELGLEKALECIKKGKHKTLSAKSKQESPDYRKMDNARKNMLKRLCKKYGLHLHNHDFLNQAFLFGKAKNYACIHYLDSYEILEYIGDSALEYCTSQLIKLNHPEITTQELHDKTSSFTNNANLSKLAQKMGLNNYLPDSNSIRDDKRHADLFESLIGAIYMDSGIEKVYEFLNKNFKNEILENT